MPTTRRSNPNVLQYAPRPLCVAHEVAPGAGGPAYGEITVAGYSLCYTCGQQVLGIMLDGGEHVLIEIIRMFRDGIIPVVD